MGINNSKLLSGRVPVTPYSNLTADRYQFLGLNQAEPSLGAGANNSVLTISTSNTRVWSNSLSISSLTVTGVSNIGNVGNVIITGGTNGYYLQTDGSGNLTWASVPTGTGKTKVYFEYISRDEFEHDSQTIQSESLSDYSDIPYDFIQYGNINDVGKQWIRKYTLALSKELLGAIREKYNSIPIPDGEVSLDGAALRAEAQVEKDALITQLRENLEEMSRKNVMENKTHESNHHQEMLRKVPLKIYVG
jgi:hypothetical protein